MNNRKSSIDGFIPRRAGSELGERHTFGGTPSSPSLRVPPRKELKSENDLTSEYTLGQPRPGRVLGRSDIDDSLSGLDDIQDSPSKKLTRKERRRIKKQNRTTGQKVRRRIIWITIIVILAGLLAAGGYLAYKTFHAAGNVLNGNIFDLVQQQPLKQDANGRSNFLILGTSEDDPGHEAGYLTDTMMVLSIDQKNKNAYTFSVPRDLYVNYGMACMSGYKGKINVYFSCSNDGTDSASEQDRLQKTQAYVGNILGMDIQYGVHVNYTVMRDVVNAIGGNITVNIQGDGATPAGIPAGSIMDSNFDWKCGATYAKRMANCPPRGHFIDYTPGQHTIDAEHALYLAQARGDIAPTWGLAQSNFDRERNQQMILMAVRDKAMSAGTLTNIGAVTGLLDALGNNLRTNVETKEVRTLMNLAHDIPSSAIKSIDLYSADNPLFTTGNIEGAGSSVYPKAGVGDYSELQAFLKKKLSSDPVVSEGANITVLNGSGVAGMGQTLADKLTAANMNVDEVGNAPKGTYNPIEIYQLNPKMTATAAKLKSLYSVTPSTATPPVSVTGSTDFLIIIGDASVVQGSESQSQSSGN